MFQYQFIVYLKCNISMVLTNGFKGIQIIKRMQNYKDCTETAHHPLPPIQTKAILFTACWVAMDTIRVREEVSLKRSRYKYVALLLRSEALGLIGLKQK